MTPLKLIMFQWSGNASVSDYRSEESSAELCDSGLPDPEVCDVLHIPPKETAVVSEAWSRGCVLDFVYCLTDLLASGMSNTMHRGVDH